MYRFLLGHLSHLAFDELVLAAVARPRGPPPHTYHGGGGPPPGPQRPASQPARQAAAADVPIERPAAAKGGQKI